MAYLRHKFVESRRAGTPFPTCAHVARSFDDDCTLCAELTGGADALNLFRRLKIQHLQSRVVAETPFLVMLVTIGPLSLGHALIVSRRHIGAIGDLSTRALEEVDGLLSAVRRVTRSSRVVVFEHGDVDRSGASGACTSHAHLHVVPDATTAPRLPASATEIAEIRSMAELHSIHTRGVPYLLTGTVGRRIRVASITDRQPCQILRRLFSSDHGTPELWDWQVFPQRDLMIESVRFYQRAGFRRAALVDSVQ